MVDKNLVRKTKVTMILLISLSCIFTAMYLGSIGRWDNSAGLLLLIAFGHTIRFMHREMV